MFWNFLPALFSSKLQFFEPQNALVTTKKARVETIPEKHRKRKKHRKEDQGFSAGGVISSWELMQARTARTLTGASARTTRNRTTTSTKKASETANDVGDASSQALSWSIWLQKQLIAKRKHRSNSFGNRTPTRNSYQLPSDTKLLLTKNYSKIITFKKLRISRVILWKKSFFFGDFEGTKSLENHEKINLRELF